jgi:hypothetical protein
MKKLLSGLFAFICVLVLASCGGGNTPTAVAEDYLDKFVGGDYEGLVDDLYFKKEVTDTDKEQLVLLLKGKVEQTVEKKGALKGYTITGEEVAEDGMSAKVTYTLEFENDKQENQKVDLVNVDGDWKVDAGK